MEDLQKKLQETKDWLQKEYAGIRTGQASPALLDNIKIDNYGAKSPINQVGTVGIEDARTLRVSVWDNAMIGAIETAVADADLGVSVATDSAGLRIVFPELTAERREQLLKLAKSKLEDARIAVRAARDEAMKSLEKQEKSGELSKDELFGEKETVQTGVEKINKELEELFSVKEKELHK
ncbi:ribosome recycling factor [Candidatus Kaiserbacteria bacterium]|nr:ribosome recycling factor [Candidatus Kaiserbacteria bacterium]